MTEPTTPTQRLEFVGFKAPPELAADLRQAAKDAGVSVSEAIRQAVAAQLAAGGPQPAQPPEN